MQYSIEAKSLDVVIPSYNSMATIDLCLQGLTNALAHSKQAGLCGDVHIYIVDDGSTDASLECIQQFISTSSYPTTLIKQTQAGPSSARNSGTQIGRAPWILYVDSDVEPHVNALSNLLQVQVENPECLAINGHPQQSVPNGGWTTQYTNLSLCYQLIQHGLKVNTAFTSLCLMSRKGWMTMDGWDTSRTSRYSDDIQSRWHFPPGSIAQCFQAMFVHHKHVSFWGLMKHRFNLGFHFRSSISNDALNNDSTVTLHWRYPVNVVCASLSLIGTTITFFYQQMWMLNILWWLPVLIVNMPLMNFVRVSTEQRFNRPLHLLSIFGLSYCEGFAMGLGLLYSLCKRPFDGRFHDN